MSAELDSINIVTSDLLTSFKSINVAIIHQSNRYYAKFGATYMVNNISWSTERILTTLLSFVNLTNTRLRTLINIILIMT